MAATTNARKAVPATKAAAPKPGAQVAPSKPVAATPAKKAGTSIKWSYPHGRGTASTRHQYGQEGLRGAHAYRLAGSGDAWTMQHGVVTGDKVAWDAQPLKQGKRGACYAAAVKHNADQVAAESKAA